MLLYAVDRGALRVQACGRAARAAGVSVGMSLAEARAVVGDELDAREYDEKGDASALLGLAVECRRFSPVCGVDTTVDGATVNCKAADGLTLDVTGCGHLFGDNRALAAEAVDRLKAYGFTVRAGLGPTVGVAWAAARSKGDRDGVCEVRPDTAAAWLDERPIAALRVPQNVCDGLADFDLHSVGQVRRLPREQLPSRFGGELLRRLDQADGTVPEAVEPVLPVEPPKASWRTDDPLRSPDLSAVVLSRLIGDLVTELPDGVGVLKLTCDVASARRSVRVEAAAARPTRSAEKLDGLVALRLEKTALPREVDRIRVEASSIDLLTRIQTDLFGDPLAGGMDTEFDDLVERLTGRLGPERVSYAKLTWEPLPERSVEFVPAIHGPPKSSADPPPLLTRPTLLLPRPKPVRVWAIERRPYRIEHRGRVHDVANVWGPERIETAWHDESGEQRRDYYRVELTGGECLWMYRTPGVSDWLLHGVF